MAITVSITAHDTDVEDLLKFLDAKPNLDAAGKRDLLKRCCVWLELFDPWKHPVPESNPTDFPVISVDFGGI